MLPRDSPCVYPLVCRFSTFSDIFRYRKLALNGDFLYVKCSHSFAMSSYLGGLEGPQYICRAVGMSVVLSVHLGDHQYTRELLGCPYNHPYLHVQPSESLRGGVRGGTDHLYCYVSQWSL